MYVKFVCLDGFKSYRDMTRIGPFDRHFNAITGLNGSGKSNILDAICFVLGISSMSVVRCKSLADCIYTGHGQTANKASVSLILDNTDKEKSPPTFKQYDEVIVSRVVQKNGDCKYYINKTNTTKRNVTDLFESVQLNVNNPNFMIMQGKITKVVNMKPKEILHMIEEAVGATLYQAKREKAENELKIKQQTMDSIEGLIHDHIKPTLDKQKRAQEQMQEYNILIREKTDKQEKYAVAHYFEVQKASDKAKQELAAILEADRKDDELAEQYKTEIKQLKQREEQMKNENTSKFKEEVAKTEAAMKSEKKKLQEKETDVKTAKEGLSKAKSAVKELETVKAKEEKAVNDFRQKGAKSIAEFEQLQQEKTRASEELEKAREQENQLRAGKVLDDEGKSMDVEQELIRLGTEIAAIQPDLEDHRQRVADNKGKLVQLERQLKQTPSDDIVEREYKQKLDEFEKLKAQANKLNINAEDNAVDIHEHLSSAIRQRDNILRERNSIMSRNYLLCFNYDTKAVGEEGVYGCMYDYIKVNEEQEWGNALDVAFGGLLGQGVVETDVIGKKLVKFGKLPRRMMIHPLNTFKSQYNRPKCSQQQLDKQFGPGNAVHALNLLEYDQKFAPIVENYMGNKVLCKTMDIARKVAFNFQMKAYTAGGDFVDPGGLMQGGTRKDLGVTLRNAMSLYESNQKLKQLGREVATLTAKLQSAKSNESFMEKLHKAKRELHHADEMRKMTKSSQLRTEIDAIKGELEGLQGRLQELETQFKTLEKQKIQCQKKADQVESLRAKHLKDTANAIKKWEKELAAATKKYESKEQHFKEVEMDIKSKEAYLNGCQKDIDDAIENVSRCEQKVAAAEQEVKNFKQKFKEYQEAYDEAVAKSNEWYEEAKRIQDKIKKLDERKEASEINKMKRNNQRKTVQDNVTYCLNEITTLEDQFQGIDFAAAPRPTMSASALKKELDSISKQVENRQTTLDQEAAAGYHQTKREYDGTADKLVVINKNKQGLKKAIETLDKSKKEKVKGAYEDVNKKFNDMMQTLLPEARAKLVEVVPGDLSQGVNIHVQLGGVWKESLTELSGGQRSLVALALVLSLCMYNPAPFYILDEVDAALDLSHTQNIGVVIQNQFKGTQFICVSLKDGMFANANVLFTAKHEGGKSVVTRTSRTQGMGRPMPPPDGGKKSKK